MNLVQSIFPCIFFAAILFGCGNENHPPVLSAKNVKLLKIKSKTTFSREDTVDSDRKKFVKELEQNFDKDGNLISSIDFDSTGAMIRIIKNTYKNGSLDSVITEYPRQKRTEKSYYTYIFSSDKKIITEKMYFDNDSVIWHYNYNERGGWTKHAMKDNWSVLQATYDSAGRLIASAGRVYTYDKRGSLVEERWNGAEGIHEITRYTNKLDDKNRIATVHCNENLFREFFYNQDGTLRKIKKYDKAGKIEKIESFEYTFYQ